jgi:hypothetical protein
MPPAPPRDAAGSANLTGVGSANLTGVGSAT